jgi:hypothetical protein
MDAELVAWEERVRGCADVQLMAELQQLVRKDRRCETRMLMYLAEVDERRLFLELGHASLFRYATAALRMSEPQAYLRIQAARLARRYPAVLELFAEGALKLMAASPMRVTTAYGATFASLKVRSASIAAPSFASLKVHR